MTSAVWSVGGVGVVVAIVAVAIARRDPWIIRIAGLLAVLVAWFAAHDRTLIVESRLAPRVVAVTTRSTELDPLRQRIEAIPGARFELVAADRLDLAIAAATSRFDVHAADLLLVWTAPFEPSERDVDAEAFVGAYTTVPVPPFEPADFEVERLAPFVVGRPAPILVRSRVTLPVGTTTRIVLRDANGTIVGEHSYDANQMPARAEFTCRELGLHTLEVLVRHGVHSMRARGEIDVAAGYSVGVVGAAAEVVVDALAVQGVQALAVDSERALECAAVVVLDPLTQAEQARFVQFVDAGGGLFVVGGRAHGALPAPGEPLHAWMPVEVLPVVDVEDEGVGVRPDAGQTDSEPGEAAAPPEIDPVPDGSDEPVTGEIDAATEPSDQRIEVERRHVSLVIVIDQSMSMGEPVTDRATRMDYAKSSASQTLRELAEEDRVGIVGFGDRAFDVLTMRPRPTPEELDRSLGALSASRPATAIATGLRRAGEWLTAETTAVRHAVILTDADRRGMDPGDLRAARTLAIKLRRAGITISVLHISAPGDDVRVADLGDMARLGGGKLHRAEDAQRVPRLLIAEVQRVLGGIGRGPGVGDGGDGEVSEAEVPPRLEPSMDEPADDLTEPVEREPERHPDAPESRLVVRAISDSVLLEPRPAAGFPSLGGISNVEGRPFVQTLLVAGSDGVPLLAFANRGLGRVGVWTSDFTSDWGREWRTSPEFPAQISQWVSHVLPASSDAVAPVATARELVPPGPTRAECAELLARAGADELQPIEAYEPPRVRTIARPRGRGADDALLALLVAIALAGVEFVARRL